MKEIQKSVAAQKAIFNGLENEWIKACERLKKSRCDLSKIKIVRSAN